MLLWWVVALAGLRPATAAISLGATRLIISDQTGDAVVQVRNEGDGPVLLQVWLDLGDPSASPEALQVPLIAETPVLRLEAGRQHALRVRFTGRPVPSPQVESLYWLNVLEVPRQRTLGQGGHLQVAFRTRIKVMYRPATIPEGPSRAWERLQARVVSGSQGRALRIDNPARVHVTLMAILTPRGQVPPAQQGLLVPGGQHLVPLEAATADALEAGGRLEVLCLDDAGQVVAATVPVVAGPVPAP